MFRAVMHESVITRRGRQEEVRIEPLRHVFGRDPVRERGELVEREA